MNPKYLIIVFLSMWSGLFGFTAEYNIKSLGLKVARLELGIDTHLQEIKIKAKSTRYGSIIGKLDNNYQIRYDTLIRPKHYTRNVNQQKIAYNVQTEYDHPASRAEMTNPGTRTKRTFNINADTRDVFSFLAYCSMAKPSPGLYPIDANGVLWYADLRGGSKTEVNTFQGKMPAYKYRLTFQKSGKATTPYIDMITFNLVNTDTSMDLWISESGVPLKAKVAKKSNTMTWELESLNE